jgi:hypothetical protein
VDRKLKRRLAIVGAVVVVFGAAGGAYAVTNGKDNEHDAYLNDLATRLHVSRDQLDSALKGAFEDRLDAAVKAGKLSQSEADNIKKKVEQGGVPFAGPFLGKGPGPDGPHGYGFGFGFKFGAAADDVAKYLDLTAAQLRDRIESGKSLADIAKAQNKSLDGLKDTIKSATKKQLDSLVAAKKITQDQADKALQELTEHIDDLVSLSPPKGLKAFRDHNGRPQFHKHFDPQTAPAPPDGGFFF